MTTPIRVLLCDDHTILREGIAALLGSAPDIRIVGQAGDGVEAIELALRLQPHVVVTDIAMPRLNGIEVVRRLGQQLPETRVLVLTMHTEEEYVLHLIRAGAAGYLLKDSAATDLRAAVRAVMAGETFFSPELARPRVAQIERTESPITRRERQVLVRVAAGGTNKEIAADLGISHRTVETHRESIARKLGISSVAGQTRYVIEHHLTDD